MTYRSPWLLRSVILLASCLASGISGYAYGVYSSPAKEGAPSKRAAVAEPPIAIMDLMARSKDLPVQQYDPF
jgi:hypothetical protein